MGCTQPSRSVLPQNHIPIERLYDSRGYPLMNTSPIVMVNATPMPSYVKSALKKNDPHETQYTDRRLFLKRKPLLNVKTVNFDEQVLVKSRTPTPNKSWYEKESATMPMRSYPRDDNDDDDDDADSDDEIVSDEEQTNDRYTDRESYTPRLGSPVPLVRRNQLHGFWHKTNATGLLPSSPDPLLSNESFPLTTQKHNFPMNKGTKDNSVTSSGGSRIKVRQRLPDFGPPQIVLDASSEATRQRSAISPRKSSIQPSTLLVRRPFAQLSTAPLHRPFGQASSSSNYRTPTHASLISPQQTLFLQPSPVSIHQFSSLQPKTISVQQLSSQPSFVTTYQVPVQNSTNTSYQYPSVQPQTNVFQQSPSQSSIIFSYQPNSNPSQTPSSLHRSHQQSSIASISQAPVQTSTVTPPLQSLPIATYQIPSQSLSEIAHVKQTAPNMNTVSGEHQNSLATDEPLSSTTA